MDRIKLTNHIREEELKLKMYRVIDICASVLKYYEPKSTEFLNPYEVENAIAILNTEPELAFQVDGGIRDSERAILCVYPYFMDGNSVDTGVRFLQIDGNFKFSSVTHRDYLGSLMGLGIKREKIGDIFVHESFCQVIVSSDICDYIIINYDKVGINRVKVKEITRSELQKKENEYDEKVISVSSARLDAVVSATYNISRQESMKLINADFVTVNYKKIGQASKILEEASIISVRRKGKFILSEIGNITKKGKIKIKIKKIV